MLTRIIFILADSGQRKAVENMKINMGEKGKIVEIWELTGRPREMAENKQEAVAGEEDTLNRGKTEGRIFVTDSGAALGELMRKGCYVIALLHEKNGQEDLSAAPYAMTDLEEMAYPSFEQAYQRLAGLPWRIAETERCIIRETTVEDVEAFYSIYAEPSITRYIDNLFSDPEEERAYVRQYIKNVYGFYGYGMWTVLSKEDGQVIGRAGLSWREGAEVPELGFVIAAPFQRRGYAYEVCRAVLDYGRRELDFQWVQALLKEDNTASAALCRKLGFIRWDMVEADGETYERYVVELR